MWNGPNFRKVPIWPSWNLLNFCQVNVPIKKWKSLKMLSSPGGWFQNYSHLNYVLFSWDVKPVLTVNAWNFEWWLIFRKYLQQKDFLTKILQITPMVECQNCQIDHFTGFPIVGRAWGHPLHPKFFSENPPSKLMPPLPPNLKMKPPIWETTPHWKVKPPSRKWFQEKNPQKIRNCH